VLAGPHAALRTERPEAIMAGTPTLVRIQREGVVEGVVWLIESESSDQRRRWLSGAYGSGKASQRIASRRLQDNRRLARPLHEHIR
jgi:UDP-N-acetylglucosamine 2-epimerase